MARRDGFYGIDLGTTNSAIGLVLGDTVRIVRNALGDEVTPSVVKLAQQSGGLIEVVGRRARDDLVIRPDGVVQRAKDFMGVPERKFQVPASAVTRTAVQVSAAVLRELVRSVKRAADLPDAKGAVITVPAIFNQAARDDTRKAGLESGLAHVELYPEPAAAALAFGHHIDTGRGATWLTYDLGGGTFDCALVRAEDGIFTVIDTHGDRRLGGGDLDVEIVKKLIAPALHGNNRSRVEADAAAAPERRSRYWWSLLLEAERAKIQLDVDDEADIYFDHGDMQFDVKLRRTDVEALQTDLFRRTIVLCGELLARNDFQVPQIQRVLMVGGPTRSAFLRRMLEHGVTRSDGNRIAGLGIALDCTVDPMTAVAQGAALYAATRSLPPDAGGRFATSDQSAQVGVEIMTNTTVLPEDEDILVTGRIHALQCESPSIDGWSVVVERMDGDVVGWQSEPAAVTPHGGFARRASLQRGKSIFEVRVFDAQKMPVATDGGGRFEVFRGIQIGEPIMEKGLGIADAHGDTIWFFRKGEHLPAGPKTLPFRTKVALKRGSSEQVVIPIVEGVAEKAYLNDKVMEFRIAFEDVKSSFPVDSPLDITISLSHDRQLAVAAVFVDSGVQATPSEAALAPAIDELRQKLALAKKNYQLFVSVRRRSAAIAEAAARIEQGDYFNECDILIAEGSASHTVPWDKASALLGEVLALQQPCLGLVDEMLVWEAKFEKFEKNMRLARDIVAEASRPAAWRAAFDDLSRRYDDAASSFNGPEAERISYGLVPKHFETLPALQSRVSGSGEALESGSSQTSKHQTTGTVSQR